MKIKLIILYLFLNSLNILSQEVPPLLSNFRIEENQNSRVYFDSSQPISGKSVAGFKISDKNIIGLKLIAGSTTGHYFSVSIDFSFWDNNTIRYEGGSNIKNKSSSLISNFTLQYIKNNIPEPVSGSNIYYVSTKGQNSNSGLSESKPWGTINHAAQIAKAGDIVYIKAGDYGNENVVVKNSGVVDKPIKFIGYKHSIHDKPYLVRNQTTNFSSLEMPYIHSSSESGTGFSLSGKKYIIIKNIQVEGYNDCVAIKSNASFNLLENIYTKGGLRMGINGFSRDAVNNRFTSCYIANVGGAGIRISGERHLIEDLYVSSNGITSMDYYISLYGGKVGKGTIIRNSSVIRDPIDSHTGHGISVKAEKYPLEYTLIENCFLQDLGQAIELRHHLVKNTVVRNVTAAGNRNSNSNLITLRDDTSYNIIENCTANGVYEGIRFLMNKGEDLGIQGGGHHNKIINTVFDNCKFNITVSGLGAAPLESTYNEFLNCTFYGSNYMFALETKFGNTNKFINCIINMVDENIYRTGSMTAEFSYTNFSNGFKKLSGIGNNSEDPNFENASNGNFRLKENSQLIDKGIMLKDVKFDFDKNSRPQGKSSDIGAFEYQDNTTSSIKADAGEDVIICKGEQTSLNASGGTQYIWSNGMTTSEINVSPDQTTTYTVTVSDGLTSDEAEVTVIVNEVIANVGADVSIDEGEEVTLTATGGDSYVWDSGENSQSITVSPQQTTTYTVTVNLDGCEATDEIKVTVNPGNSQDPNVIVADAGPDQSICLGESVILSATGGDSYVWSNGAETKSIEVAPGESTFYTVTAFKGSVSATDEVYVNVNSVVANAGENISINQGESIKLTASAGTDYLWSNGADTRSITVQPSNTTNYSVRVSNGNCQDSDDVKITVIQEVNDPTSAVLNAGENQTICLGEAVTLSAQGGVDYVWSTGESGEKIIVNPLRTSTYEVTSNTNGTSTTDSVTITVENCISSSDEPVVEETNIQLYPNPTTGILKIQTGSISLDTDIHLINMNGKILLQDTLKSQQGNFGKQLDLSNFTKGIYFIRFLNEEEQLVKKIVLI